MDPLIDAVLVSSANSVNESIKVYEAATGVNIRGYKGPILAPGCLTTVGESDYILGGLKSQNSLTCWALHKYDNIAVTFSLLKRPIALACNNVGPKYCAVALSDKIYFYQLSCGKLIGVLAAHYQPVTCLKFTSCGQFFASGGEDGFVYLWSKATLVEATHKLDKPQAKPRYILGQHSNKVTDLSVTSAGIRGLLASSSLDHTVKVYDLITGQTRYNIIVSTGVTSVSLNALGSHVFLGGKTGLLWSVSIVSSRSTGDIQIDSPGLPGHTGPVTCLQITYSGGIVISGGSDGEVKTWIITDLAEDTSRHTMGNITFLGQVTGLLGELNRNVVPIGLAKQRVIHSGRGEVTNVVVMRVQREKFHDLSPLPKFFIQSLSTQGNESALSAPIFHTVCRSQEKYEVASVEEMFRMARKVKSRRKVEKPQEVKKTQLQQAAAALLGVAKKKRKKERQFIKF